jgi:hypothetical protein
VAHLEHGAPTFTRVTSSPSRLSTNDDDEDAKRSDGDELVQHRQIYGFVGSNDFVKIGWSPQHLCQSYFVCIEIIYQWQG